MADRADVYVKNVLSDDIKVIRKLPDGSNDINTTVVNGDEEKIHLPGPEVELVINAPLGLDTKECSLKVKSDVDLKIGYSRKGACWTIKIEPNDLPPDSPLSVNVNVGEDGP